MKIYYTFNNGISREKIEIFGLGFKFVPAYRGSKKFDLFINLIFWSIIISNY